MRAAAIDVSVVRASGKRRCYLFTFTEGNQCHKKHAFYFIPNSMTDLLHTIPHFPTKLYTHLLPSLEKHLITTTDLLTLDPLDVAKRAQLPLLDVRRLANHVLAILQRLLGLKTENAPPDQDAGEGLVSYGSLRKTGKEKTSQLSTISTLDPALDAVLGGGIPTGYISEVTGERHGFWTSTSLNNRG